MSDECPSPAEAPSYRYFVGESSFSIYEEMVRLLRERGGEWEAATKPEAITTCALILGDRFNIPYDRLRGSTRVFGPEGRKPLVNYFKGSHRLTLKAAMARLLREAVPHVDDFMPRSFILGRQATPSLARSSSRFSKFRGSNASTPASSPVAAPADERQELLCAHARKPSAWIVKPSAGCKGVGIRVCATAEEAITAVDEAVAAEKSADSAALFAVQEYIANPLLLPGGRKFDIRVWALVAAPFDIYVWDQGSCRTASVAYDANDLSNPLAHLTNHGLQQSSASFGEHEEGNELWYSALDAELRRRFGDGTTFVSHVRPQIDRVVRDTLYAAKEGIEVGEHESFECFQLFGFDLMLDDALKLHLIEINGSPGSADRWLEPIVAGMLKLVVDSRFPPTDTAKAAIAASDARIAALSAKDGEVGSW
eukprot:CAMPEP_0174880448 /NCGR_PEP_ID=MMETSP1114-20130205/83768_1 /TAXON_ID=312471 /ORGANISM="Neobodo designis, Strain CCAP 1951/1" /LENGTH=423 /DNA_ID=CAMNT_0016115843 /DNA_START=29 /DNA_END=1297 /DNA_ORIENTATION=-